MALTKQSFLLLITTLTQWSGPTLIRISGDESVSGQIRRKSDGGVEYSFPERVVVIANHQVMLFLVILTGWLADLLVALYRMVVLLVDRIRQPTQDARPHLYRSQRVLKICTCTRPGHDVLWFHIFVTENGQGQAQTCLSTAKT